MESLSSARCIRCGAENEAENKFCSACGAKFVPRPDPVSAGEEGLYYCWKHKREPTRVTCGRCEKPICPKCMIVGANGVRCKECARNRVPVRFSGLFHDITSGLSRNVVIAIVIAFMFFGIPLLSMIVHLITMLMGGDQAGPHR